MHGTGCTLLRQAGRPAVGQLLACFGAPCATKLNKRAHPAACAQVFEFKGAPAASYNIILNGVDDATGVPYAVEYDCLIGKLGEVCSPWRTLSPHLHHHPTPPYTVPLAGPTPVLLVQLTVCGTTILMPPSVLRAALLPPILAWAGGVLHPHPVSDADHDTKPCPEPGADRWAVDVWQGVVTGACIRCRPSFRFSHRVVHIQLECRSPSPACPVLGCC